MDTGGMPDHVLTAAWWAARVIGEQGRVVMCGVCRVVGRRHLWCASCGETFCMGCLKLPGRELWDLNFECAGCAIESLCVLGDFSRHEQRILDLADDWLLTRASAIKPGTWRIYKRALQRVIQFMLDTGIVAFPVIDRATARGLCFFFQHLKRTKVSWAVMAQVRSAITNVSRAAGLSNPWHDFPQLEELSQGLARELTVPTARREGVTVGMMMRLIRHLEHLVQTMEMLGNMKRADVALRNLVAICFGFWGMR